MNPQINKGSLRRERDPTKTLHRKMSRTSAASSNYNANCQLQVNNKGKLAQST